MGELLKREFELLALNVRLRYQREEGGYIDLEIATHQGGVAIVRRSWKLSLSEQQLPDRLPTRESVPALKLSPQVLAELKGEIDGSGVRGGEPLWLYLKTPYGFLGALNWEAVLVPALGRPVLRLPDFLERPRENTKTFDVAICCSTPDDEPRFDAASLVREAALLAFQRSQRSSTRVHVFVDANLRARLSNDPAIAANSQIWVYQGSASLLTIGRSDSWLEWIQRELDGKTLDAVHFIAHGNLSGDQPYLAVTDDPANAKPRRNAQFLSVGETVSFLTQCGAWAALFSAPPASYSPAGLRLFADLIAQTRPGVVLTHDMALLDWQSGLGAAYGFLFAVDPQFMPAQADVAISCPPALVAREPGLEVQTTPATAPVNSPLTLSLESIVSANGVLLDTLDYGLESTLTLGRDLLLEPRPKSAPSWLSASQRYFELAKLRVPNLQQSTTPGGDERRTKVALETLKQLQSVVHNVASNPVELGLSLDVTHAMRDIEKLK